MHHQAYQGAQNDKDQLKWAGKRSATLAPVK